MTQYFMGMGLDLVWRSGHDGLRVFLLKRKAIFIEELTQLQWFAQLILFNVYAFVSRNKFIIFGTHKHKLFPTIDDIFTRYLNVFFFVFQQSDPASKSSSSSSKTVAMFSNTIAIIFLALLALQSVDAWHPFGNSRDVRYANQPQNQNQNRVSSGDSKDSKVFFLKYFPFYNNSIIWKIQIKLINIVLKLLY